MKDKRIETAVAVVILGCLSVLVIAGTIRLARMLLG